MEIHPRIRRRIRLNWAAQEAEIQCCRASAVIKLDSVLSYLRGANILSESIDVDGLIAEIEKVRSEFISFRISAENPASMRDAIAPRIGRIRDQLKRLELEQEVETAAAPST